MNLDRLLVKAKGLETGQWYVGDFHRFKSHYYDDKGHDCYINHYTVNGRNIDPDTICQCTGLRDKHGKLVFENDVIHAKKWNPIGYTVKFDRSMWGAVDKDDAWATDLDLFYDSKGCMFEVIGNVLDKED